MSELGNDSYDSDVYVYPGCFTWLACVVHPVTAAVFIAPFLHAVPAVVRILPVSFSPFGHLASSGVLLQDVCVVSPCPSLVVHTLLFHVPYLETLTLRYQHLILYPDFLS